MIYILSVKGVFNAMEQFSRAALKTESLKNLWGNRPNPAISSHFVPKKGKIVLAMMDRLCYIVYVRSVGMRSGPRVRSFCWPFLPGQNSLKFPADHLKMEVFP
jgi:hypothetical protein